MKDTRVIRQGFQALIGLAALCAVEITASPFDWRKLVAAIIAGCGLLLTNPRLVPGVKEGMPAAGSSAAPPTPTVGSKPLAFVLFTFVAFTVPSCHNITPDSFAGATVDCATVNPEASAALASVEACLLAVVASNYGACLSGLVTEAHFAIDEVACVVAWYSQQQNVKVAAGKYTPADLESRKRAVDWLAAEHISIRNSYSGAQ
jgi:hypothetical protein